MNIDEIDFSKIIPKEDKQSSIAVPLVQQILGKTEGQELVEETEEEIVRESNEEEPTMCSHTCACGRGWSHGLYKNCKSPNIVEVSPCWECVREKTAEAAIQETQEHNKGVGTGLSLSGADEIDARNRERLTCKGMTLEQVCSHIETIKKIENLYRVKQLEAGRIKRELEEEEISKLLTDEEREAFRRKVKDMKKKPAPSEKQDKKRQSAIEKAIQSMVNLGMTREGAEAIVMKSGGKK